ncbi:MAG: cupredoxin family copper-binding protein [Chloroflexi bacterium]|nr:cupredoxin family copper-binding protein [Chloroflexota bacterium]
MRLHRATRGVLTGLVLFSLLFVALSCSSPAPTPAATATPSPVLTPAPAPSPTPSPGPVEVQIARFAFSPAEISIKLGTRVTWSNLDATPHTITASDKSFESGRMEKNDSFSYTFNSKGTYEYVCAYHANMKGKVNVVE